jgi:hypothetical protein
MKRIWVLVYLINRKYQLFSVLVRLFSIKKNKERSFISKVRFKFIFYVTALVDVEDENIIVFVLVRIHIWI